jgi:exosortase
MDKKSAMVVENLPEKCDCENGCAGGASGFGEDSVIDRFWRIGIAFVLFCILFWQELAGLLKSWSTPNESHGILIPAFSLYFIYQQRVNLRRTKGKPSFLGALLLVLALLGYLWSIISTLGYPRPVMMVVAVGAIVLMMGGWPIVRKVWLPVVFLLFAIELPPTLHETLTMPMREWASTVVATILNFFPDINCEASGVLIHGIHRGEVFDLNVAEACSGMRLLRTFVALGVAMAYLEYRPIVHRIILLLSTVPIAIFGNILRVFITGIVYVFIGPEYAEGTLHMVLGLMTLVVAFGLYGLLAWVMNNLYVPGAADSGDVLVTKRIVNNK